MKCRYCGYESKSTKYCGHCGRKMKKSKKPLLLVISLLLVVTIVSFLLSYLKIVDIPFVTDFMYKVGLINIEENTNQTMSDSKIDGELEGDSGEDKHETKEYKVSGFTTGLLSVDDKYVYSDGQFICVKNSVTGTGEIIADMNNTGHIMSDGDMVYFTAMSDGSKDSQFDEVYCVGANGANLNKLFEGEGKVSFITCYNDYLFYLDNIYIDSESVCKLNRYDLKKGENTELSSVLNLGVDNNLGNYASVGTKIYFEINNDSTYGEVVEFNMETSKVKSILQKGSVVSSFINAQEGVVCLESRDSDDWKIYFADGNNITESALIPAKLTLSQGVITSDGSYALMMSNMGESDFDLYKVNLKTGEIDVIKNGAGGFKGKGSGLGYDEVKREDIYLIGAGDSIRKFTGDDYETLNVDGEYDPYMCWIVDGYVINRDFEWCKIEN